MKINANSFFDLFKKKDNDDDNNNNNGESGGGNKQLDEWPSIFGDDDEQNEGADGPGWNAMKNWYNENKAVIEVGAEVALTVGLLFIPGGFVLNLLKTPRFAYITYMFLCTYLTIPPLKVEANEDFNEATEHEPKGSDPIIFDLDNNGVIETTDISNGVFFDHDNNGFSEASAWVGKNDAILFLDKNNNNKLDNGSEIVTIQQLIEKDINNDSIINISDELFSSLKLFKGDGTIYTLNEANVQSINLEIQQTIEYDEFGNKQISRGSWTDNDGIVKSVGWVLTQHQEIGILNQN